MKVTGNGRETHWLAQRVGLAVQRGNALSILEKVRDRYDAGWIHALSVPSKRLNFIITDGKERS